MLRRFAIIAAGAAVIALAPQAEALPLGVVHGIDRIVVNPVIPAGQTLDVYNTAKRITKGVHRTSKPKGRSDPLQDLFYRESERLLDGTMRDKDREERLKQQQALQAQKQAQREQMQAEREKMRAEQRQAREQERARARAEMEARRAQYRQRASQPR